MKTIIGDYGLFVESLIQKSPGSLSFRNGKYSDVRSWRKKALKKTWEYLAPPVESYSGSVKPVCKDQYIWDGLYIEELEWQLPYGPKTQAIFLKPEDAVGKLPGVLALHDHGGKKFWGYKKIARGREEPCPILQKHHEELYQGLCWANEIAKKGFAVLVHDTFPFGSRRVNVGDVSGNVQRGASVKEPVTDSEIEQYNEWAFTHEHDMAKSLFSAGATWPGVTLMEDRIAFDILSGRIDVDKKRLACGGLSGGGMRTVFLAGLDERIKCAVCVGFMTTWKDFSLYSAQAHTWMTFVPGLPGKLDFPEILGLRVPLPTLVLNNTEDPLFMLDGMNDANKILGQVYAKAGAKENYHCSFYPGKHKFNREMQEEAFNWLGRWL